MTISVAPEADSALCPACGGRSERVHGRYVRTFSDLPWHGVAVVFRARVRCFFCGALSCERRTFCERLSGVAARARKTNRSEEALLAIVLELGGRAGARLAEELGLLAGFDLLRARMLAA